MPEKEPQSCATPFRTMIGGQALIEGIMMLGPEKKSIVVRRPDGGLEIKTEERKLIKDRHPILGWPFIRGVVNFCTSMYTGVTALMYSAEFYPEDEAGEEEPSRFEQWLDKKLGSEKAMSLFTTLAVILGMAFSVGLFFVLPTLLSGAIMYFFPAVPLWARNVVEGATRVVIFLGYLILCSKMKDIRRVFSYHGAEHKTIFCYEKGLELTVENGETLPAASVGETYTILCRYRGIDPPLQRRFCLLAIHQPVAADAGPSCPPARGGGTYLGIQPLCGRTRQSLLPRRSAARHGHSALDYL